jgi:5-methylcytosine-specific restriction protein A
MAWPYIGPWRKVRRAVLVRDGNRCRIRGPACTIRATCVDHIVPWRKGGALYDPANLRAACHACNTERSNEDMRRTPRQGSGVDAVRIESSDRW